MVHLANMQATSFFVKFLNKTPYVVCLQKTPVADIEEDNEPPDLKQVVLSRTKEFVELVYFNFPDINSENGSASRKTPRVTVLQWLFLHDLTQYWRQDTRHRVGQCPSLLDLMIIRYQGDTRTLASEDPLGESGLCFLWQMNSYLQPLSGRLSIEIKMTRAAVSMPWLSEHASPTVEERWTVIKIGLISLMEQFISSSSLKANVGHQAWLPKIRRLIRTRKRIWATYKTYRAHQTYKSFLPVSNNKQAL